MAITIRRAEPRDLEALGRLGAMLLSAHHEFDSLRFLPPGDADASGYAAFLGGVLDDPEGCVLVAEEGGQVAGYVYVTLLPASWKELRGPAGFLHDVAVSEAARHHGVARALMEAGLDWLRRQDVPRVVLWTAAGNDAARELFRRFGFRDTMVEMTRELQPPD